MSDSKRPGSYAQAYRDAVDQLAHIRDASAVDHIERIIEHARANNDEIAVVQWLLQLIRAASHFDRFDREIKAFHELMAIYRAGKGDGDLRRNLLWHFKWLLERITERHGPGALDIPARLYPLFLQSFLSTVAEFDASYNAEVEAAWRSALAPGFAVVSGGAR